MSQDPDAAARAPRPGQGSVREVFAAFLKLGLTSFGGPVAHLGYFREAFVERRRWLDERAYADLVALAQFLPGPASSQVGFGLGLARAGLPGAFAAWLAFTMPSALLMVAFGYGVVAWRDVLPAGLLHGLKVVAVAVVAQAVWGMARSLCPDAATRVLALAAAAVLVVVPTPLAQVGVILAGGGLGYFLFRDAAGPGGSGLGPGVGRRAGAALLALFAALLLGLPVLAAAFPSQALALFDAFFRAGSLVFGGGHVVLPLLQSEVVPTGWVAQDAFLAGYGAAQAVPGPLFSFAAYLGTVAGPEPNGWAGAMLCLVAIYVPSFLLVAGILPYWDAVRAAGAVRRALVGVNAAVVGLLLAAFYDPVWTTGVRSAGDLGLALVAFAMLTVGRWPPWLVVLFCAAGGWGLGALA